MKQFLLYLSQILVPVERKFLVSIFLLVFSSVFGQNAIVGPGFSTGWGGGGCPTGSVDFKSLGPVVSGTYGVTTIANGTGDQFFRFGVDWSGTTAQLTITPDSDVAVVPNTTYSLNTSCTTSGAIKYNVPSTSYNYVFKTLNAGTNPTGKFVFFEVQGSIRSVSSVTQSPLLANVTLCSPTNVTATLDGALSAGQAVYMRYTKDSYANSTVVQLTGSGTIFTGTIPSSFNTAGANVSYYLFTSGTTTPSGADADLYTINLNNNGGPNYSYTVGGATTAIPDPNFEQALIALNLDCAIDGKVLTSNISNVESLTLSGKNIASLVGINDFINLKYLDCANNALTSLNISGLTNLLELVTNNNQISSLDVSSSPNLYFLDCEKNQIISLNISGLTRLETLIVWVNKLTSIDVSNNSNLSYLDCDDNFFTSINVSGLTQLNQFYCSGNELASLDVRGLTNLASFYCTYNPLLTCILVDNVAAAVLKTTTVDPDPEGDGSFLWATDDDSFYSYCGCGLPPTTWNGTTWNNGAPVSTQDAIIAGPYSQSAPITACSLTINNNAVVVIPSGTNVTLNAPVMVTSGSFTLENNANLVQTNKNSINSGTITVNRNSNPLKRLDYTIWSSPVANQNLLAFSPLTTVIASPPSSRFYNYDSATNFYSMITDPSASSFAKGAGYLIRMPNEDPSNLGGGSPYSLGTAAITYNGVFTGVPNNGDIPVTLNYVDALHGYNMVGNPYSSTIDANTFITANTGNIESTLYFWRKTNGSSTAYAAYNPLGGTLTYASTTSEVPNGKIQVGQGFFVQAKSAVTVPAFFTNAMREVSPTSTQFFKTKQVVKQDRVWLNLTNATGVFSQALVGYVDGASQGIDIYDGKYINDSKVALTSNINNEEYTIQGRPSFDPSDVVALNFKTDVAGDYTIAIDHADGLFANAQDIYLTDAANGSETDLKAGSYTFTAAAGVDNARFSLKYQRTLKVDVPTFTDNSVTVFKNKGTLYVSSGAVAIANIKVFDIQGRLIAEQKNVKANTTTIKDLKAVQQVLIVKITSQDNKVVSKKVVN